MLKARFWTLLAAAACLCAQTQLTIYNQNFGVVKERRVLDLKAGENEFRMTDITAHLETDSVVLRDIKRPDSIRILEQNYERDPLNEGLLLRKSEGKVLDFEISLPGGEKRIVRAKVLRSGYVPHTSAFSRYGQQYIQQQMVLSSSSGAGQPIVEINGKVAFGLPGRPVFDSLDPASFLKPTLLWRLWSDAAGKHETELSYLSGGMRWEATYNAVAPEKGDQFDLIGWVTLENVSGKDFENASIKLMAGDVARNQRGERQDFVGRSALASEAEPGTVTERSFDEYHLYALPRATTLLDREIKQVEFVRASSVPAQRIYVYDGLYVDPRYDNWNRSQVRTDSEFGTRGQPKVWVLLQFRNEKASRLGMPLPRGSVKLYRRDSDGRNEFIGESRIDHTATDETVRIQTGAAFDLVGERKRTDFRIPQPRQMDETFEIRVRNHKPQEVEVRVVEHLYRWHNWEIRTPSMPYKKADAQTIEFTPRIVPKGEAVITYTVHYSW